MAIGRCPGQDKRFWKSEDAFEAACPNCDKMIEFWKDEPRRRCHYCGKRVLNPKIDLGCAKWCKFAKDCLGLLTLPDMDASLCDALISEMREAFGGDEARISRAIELLDLAEQILQVEGGDPLVVKAAAVLYDIDSAASICRKLGVDNERTEHICRIIAAGHGQGADESLEYEIVRGAEDAQHRKG